jgi:Na+/melibiose symporter-like transporter
MLWEVGGYNEADVGFYSGVIVGTSERSETLNIDDSHQESLFSLTQMALMISWGRAADHYGRKPVLVICLIGCAIGTGLFGLSQNFWQMILCRCFAGVFGGMIVSVFCRLGFQ